eukprot:COSAG03_NODE_3966_length_1736_cov_3.196090_2_plen_146_part_00
MYTRVCHRWAVTCETVLAVFCQVGRVLPRHRSLGIARTVCTVFKKHYNKAFSSQVGFIFVLIEALLYVLVWVRLSRVQRNVECGMGRCARAAPGGRSIRPLPACPWQPNVAGRGAKHSLCAPLLVSVGREEEARERERRARRKGG